MGWISAARASADELRAFAADSHSPTFAIYLGSALLHRHIWGLWSGLHARNPGVAQLFHYLWRSIGLEIHIWGSPGLTRCESPLRPRVEKGIHLWYTARDRIVDQDMQAYGSAV